MYRVLFRIGVLSAAVIIGGTAAAAVGGSNGVMQALATSQGATDSSICILINDFWYCFEDLEVGQSSSRSVSASS